MMTQKHGLGRGLSSLIPQKNTKQNNEQIVRTVAPNRRHSMSQKNFKQSLSKKEKDISSRDFVEQVPVGMLRVNTQQPRMYFDEDKLLELSNSIKTHGVLQPLVALNKGDHYELIAGERRLRASKKAGLSTVPVVVKSSDDIDDQKKLELALIENIQRHDLNVIEEAKSYKRLADDFDLSQVEIAARTGKSRSAVANRMRLLSLPVDVQKGLITGKISEGHAKVIMGLDTAQKQMALYDMIISRNMTVRQVENTLVKNKGIVHKKHSIVQTPHERRLEVQLSKYFGTRVRVKEGGQGGNITLSYFSQEELKNILSRLKLQ